MANRYAVLNKQGQQCFIMAEGTNIGHSSKYMASLGIPWLLFHFCNS